MNKFKELLSFKLKQIQFWYKKHTYSRADRLEVTLLAIMFTVLAGFVLFIIVIGWKLFLGLAIIVAIAATISSPIWVWILRGKKL